MGFTNFFQSIFGNAPATPTAAQPAAPPAPPLSPQAATTVTPVNQGRTLIIHGYSAKGTELLLWKNALAALNIKTLSIEVGNYITLNNEVTIKDLGEAFDRALRLTPWSTQTRDDIWTFDAIVHSTGMLVVRQWLASDPFPSGDPRSRVGRLKHLVGLAPATFGSPQAQKGRSFLGALVKGAKQLGPDFLNAGDQVLDGLELGSRFTWELAHKDMLCDPPLYDKGSDTPYAAVFIGNVPYDGIAALSNSPGSDGTIRWAGCALNARKVSIDFRREPKLTDAVTKSPARYCMTPWADSRLSVPMIAVPGQNHGTIVSQPNPHVATLIDEFLQVADDNGYGAWQTNAQAFGKVAMDAMDATSAQTISGVRFGGAGWQQLLVHVLDDHGDPVTDYNLQIYIGDDLSDSDQATFQEFPPIPLIADTYTSDHSFRCFYVRLSAEMLAINTPDGHDKKMWIELIASTGSDLLAYEAYTGPPGEPGSPQPLTIAQPGHQPVKLDITGLAQAQNKLLFPYTTTLLEIFVEREPLPLGQVSRIFNFLGYDSPTG